MFSVKIILFFFVSFVFISGGINELSALQREKTTALRRWLTWIFMVILPTLIAVGTAIRYWPF